MPSILFVNTQLSSTKSTILHSQFYQKASIYKKVGFKTSYFGADYYDACATELESIKNAYSFDNLLIKYCLPKGGFIKLNIHTYKLKAVFLQYLKKKNFDIIYFRNCFDFLFFSPVCRQLGIKTIYDSRSLLFSEVMERNRSKGRLLSSTLSRAIKYAEKFAIQRCDYLFTVSLSMHDWIFTNFGRASDSTIPCTCDTNLFRKNVSKRKEIRDRLGLEGTNVMVYCGGAGEWQRLSDIMTLFSALYHQHNTARLLLITNAQTFVIQKMSEIGLSTEQVKLVSCSHEDVPAFLSAGDVGIVLRHDCLLNRVASPIKIGEYLSCSLPVICSDYIGDYSQKIASKGAGLVLSDKGNQVQNLVDTFMKILQELDFYSSNARRMSIEYDKSIELENVEKVFGPQMHKVRR